MPNKTIEWSGWDPRVKSIKLPKGSTFISFVPDVESDRLFFVCRFKSKYEIYEIKEIKKGGFKKVKCAEF